MKFFKRIAAMVLAVVLAASFAACGGGGSTVSASAVAATVGDAEILEADVTARIETFRVDSSTGDPMDDVTWAQLLKSAGYDPESLREYVILQQYAMPILIIQEAEDAGITIDTAAIDEQISQQKADLGDDGEAWTNYLKQSGYATETAYRQYLEAQSVITPLLEAKAPSVTPSQQEIEEYVATNAAVYASKRSSAIYFATDGENGADARRAEAEEVLARLSDGEDFATLAAEYSDDTTSRDKGGDMGWSIFVSVPQEYTEALSALSVGETSGLVETDYGLYIIKATDEFGPGEDGTVDYAAVPEDIATMLASALEQNNAATAQQSYIDSLLESDKLVINPMPKGLSYDVDMALADQPAEDATGEEQPAEQPAVSDELGIVDTVEGTGEVAKIGDTVTVNYTGYLEDGTVFDSSYDRGETFSFTIGAGSVIQGWEQGIPGMKVGGKRQLTIPASLAYGETGQGSIPPNATLIFDVELVSIG